MIRYCYESIEGLLCRIDNHNNIYEAYNWKDKKWEQSENAFQVANWYCDHLSECVTEEQANRLIQGEDWKNIRTGNEKVFTGRDAKPK